MPPSVSDGAVVSANFAIFTEICVLPLKHYPMKRSLLYLILIPVFSGIYVNMEASAGNAGIPRNCAEYPDTERHVTVSISKICRKGKEWTVYEANVDSCGSVRNDPRAPYRETADNVMKRVEGKTVRDFLSGFLTEKQLKVLDGLRTHCFIRLLKDGSISNMRLWWPSEIVLTADEFSRIYSAFNNARMFGTWTSDVNVLTIDIPLIYYPYQEHETVEIKDTVENLAISIINNREWLFRPYYIVEKCKVPEWRQNRHNRDQGLEIQARRCAVSGIGTNAIRDIFAGFMTENEKRMLAGGNGSASFIITKSGEILFLSLRLNFPRDKASSVFFTADELVKIYDTFSKARLFGTWNEDIDSITLRFRFEFQ